MRLVEIAASASSLGGEFAAATLIDEIAELSEAQFHANFSRLLEAAFRLIRPDIVAESLRRKFMPDGEVSVATTPALSKPCIVLFEKLSRGKIRLTFSRSLCDEPDVLAHANWLAWGMPMLSQAADSDLVPCGACFLNHWDAGIVPGLSACASGNESFLVPDNVFMPSRGYALLKAELKKNRVAWSDREPIAFWRGATTGHIKSPALGWRSLHRVSLCEISRQHPELIDAGFSKITQMSPQSEREIRAAGLLRSPFPANQLQAFRYLIDVDGNSNAWSGLFERLLTGSPVLKIASPGRHRQWYYDRLLPWHNFVPVNSDMADLVDKVSWLKAHDGEAKRIGAKGRALAYSLDYAAELARAIAQIAAAFRAFSAESRGRSLRQFLGSEFVRSCHGSILAYHSRECRLVHVFPESALLRPDLHPLKLVQQEARGRLLLASGSVISTIRPDGSAELASRSDSAIEPIALSAGTGAHESLLALKIKDRFLCAARNETVTADRPRALAWEHFHSGSIGW